MTIRREFCVLTLVVSSFLAACGDEAAQDDTLASTRNAPASTTDASRTWRHAARFEMPTQRGQPLGTEDLAGRVWVATFVDTRCAEACDATREAIEALARTLGAQEGEDALRVVSFAVDPAHDTPDRLLAHAAARSLAADRFLFLSGTKEEAAFLQREGFLGPGQTPRAGGPEHTHEAAVVDRRGRVRACADPRQPGGRETLRAALREALAVPPVARKAWPPGSLDPDWLAPRARAQIAAAKGWSVQHDFRFEDRRPQSGIRFLHRCVDDGARTYRPVHYDHGNGVAVADVDGDGRLDLYFCNQVGGNQLWRNLGGGRFEDVTERAGVAVRAPTGVTASFADTDNDGDPDLYVTTVKSGNLLFVNDGTGRFQDVSEQAGLDHVGHSSSGVFFDYDRDGLLDLFLCNVGVYTTDKLRTVIEDSTTSGQEQGPFRFYDGVPDAFSGHLKPERTERSILYRNLGGNRFEDVTAKMKLVDESWTGAATPIDMNEDGWLDLYVLNMQGHDEYYENVGGKAFRKRSREVFPKTPWGSMGVKVFDFDRDGRLDLYVTDMHSDMSRRAAPDEEKQKSRMTWPETLLRSGGMSIYGNAFFRRVGPDKVTEVSDAIGAENYWPWGLSVGDLNADGFDDVFIASSMNYFWRYGVNSVLLNDHGRAFLDSEFVLGVEPRKGPLFKPWFDLDCMTSEDAEHRLCEGQPGFVTAWGPLGSRSSVLFDLDDDGDLDIVTNDMNSEPLVLVSDLAQRHPVHQLTIRLRGRKSNRDGLGAIVRVRAGGAVQTKVHDGQSGYLSQSSQPLYFGLGDASAADRVEVLWPSGATQVVAEPKPGSGLLEIVEPP